MDFDKYPKSDQGGIFANKGADHSNNQPPYRGHIVVTEEMLKTLVVLMRNRAWKQEGEFADLGPRIALSAWLNTSKEGNKYFKVSSNVYYGDEYNYLFDDNAEQPIEQAAPESAPAPAAAEDKDFPF